MHVKDSITSKWITKGIIISRNKLRLLHNIKRSTNLPMKSLKYIQNYQMIYRKAIKKIKKKKRREREGGWGQIDSFYQLKIKKSIIENKTRRNW